MSKLRVVFYARVSTNTEDQAHSFETQQEYFKNYINQNKAMIFVRGYADEGISGISTKNRVEFLQMIEDARNGDFDLILTKEVSRFARNTVDTLSYTRELSTLGVGVLFTNDGIDTREKDGELRLTIMASIAQDESRKISERINWAVQRNYENGVAHGGMPYGYRRNEKKEIVIYEPEAKYVRIIFDLYLQGNSYRKIINELKKDPIISQQAVNWTDIKISNILKNPKYCGDLVQGLSVTSDFLSKKRIKQTDESKVVYIKDHHEPIVSREIFEQAQNERKKRQKLIKVDKVSYSTKYLFSNKVFCGHCKKSFTKKAKVIKDVDYSVWRCTTKAKLGAPYCPTRNNIKEAQLYEIMKKVYEYLYVNKEDVVNKLTKIFDTIMKNNFGKDKVAAYYEEKEKLEKQIDKLIDLKLNDLINIDLYDKKYKLLNNELEQLNKKLDLTFVKKQEDYYKNYLNNLEQVIIKYTEDWKSIDDELLSKILCKIVVFTKEEVDVYLHFDKKDAIYSNFNNTFATSCTTLK